MAHFKDDLLSMRQKIRDKFEDRIALKPTIPNFAPKAGQIALTEVGSFIAKRILAATHVDVFAYEPTPDPGIQLHPKCLQSAAANRHVGGSRKDLSKSLVRYMVKTIEPLAPEIQEKCDTTGCFLLDIDLRSAYFPQKEKSIFDQQTKDKMGLDNQLLFRFLHAELDSARDNPEAYHSSSKVVQSLQRIVSMYAQGNIANTMTAFQTLQGESPNDKLVSYITAHIYYHRTTHGHSQFLPKARQEAKKATAGHDKINPHVLTRFRYHLAALDAGFSKERLLELLSSHELLTPPEHQQADSTSFAFYIKSMVLLSQTDIKDWSDREVKAIKQLAEGVIGGGFIYNAFFFEKLEGYLFNNKDDVSQTFAPLLSIHETFTALEEGLSNFGEARAELGEVKEGAKTPAYRWTVSQEMFKKCLANMPIPTFEDILINTSLNAEMFTPTEQLDRQLREQGLMVGPYWPLWLGKLIPTKEIYAPNNIPDQVVKMELQFLSDIEDLLASLKEEENQRIDHEKWQFTHPYQTHYSYDRIISAGIGRTYTNLTFAPQNAILKSHYELWGSDSPKALLYSDIIAEKAENAGFAGIKEIMGVFDGVLKIMGDAEYGLKAKQKYAWEAYLQQQNAPKGGGASAHAGDYLQRLLSELWWFFIFVLPGAFAAFILVASSGGFSSGIKIFLSVMIVLGFAIALAVAVFQGSKIEKTRDRTRIPLDEDGNPIGSDLSQEEPEEGNSLQDMTDK